MMIGRAFSHSLHFKQRCSPMTTFFTRDMSSDLDKFTVLTQTHTPWENIVHANIRSLSKSKTPFLAADRIGQIFNLLENEDDLRKFFTILTNNRDRDFIVDEATNALWKEYQKQLAPIDPLFKKGNALDSVVKTIIAQAFCPGALQFRELFLNEPEQLLNNVINNESVHPVEESTFHHRFNQGKHMYALIHPDMPTDPVSFVSVSLLHEMPKTMLEVMGPKESSWRDFKAKNATFYSVNSPHKALTGVDVGNIMIKKTVRHLQSKYKSLNEFSTLSPLPDFVSWIKYKLEYKRSSLWPPEDIPLYQKLFPEAKDGYEALEMIVNDPSCILKPESDEIREPLIRLAAKYLRSSKPGASSGPIDPVCNFHSRNGAFTTRLNWKADLSKIRLSQSLGIMVNYVYDESQLASNMEEYNRTKKCNATKEFLEIQYNNKINN